MISGPIPPHPRVLLQDLWLEPEVTGSAEAPSSFAPSSSPVTPSASAQVPSGSQKTSKAPSKAPQAEEDPLGKRSCETPLDPRVFTLESGWKLLARDLCFGKGLEVDFLGMDANRAPIAVLALGEEEQELCPLRMLDLKAWFQRNKEMIRQTWMRVCPELVSLDLHRELRFFLIAHEFSQGLMERLACLSSFDLRVFRLRSLGVRGRHYWYAEGVAPWTTCSKESSPLKAPSGVETESVRERINTFLSQVQIVGEGLVGRKLDFEGGRFDRRVLVDNEVVLELGVIQEQVWVRIPGYANEFSLGQPEEQAGVLDRFLRSLMVRNRPSWGSVPIPSLAQDSSGAQPDGSPDGGFPELAGNRSNESAVGGEAFEERNRFKPSPLEGQTSSDGRVLAGPGRSSQHLNRAEGPRLSDEEMAAFFGS